MTAKESQIIVGQPTTGKNYRNLGSVYINKPGKRRGFTARLQITPTSPRIIMFARNGGALGKEGEAMAVYAVNGKTKSRGKETAKWEPFGHAKLTHDGRMIEIVFDRFPPKDDEGHMVFSVLERTVGDVDHPSTIETTEQFLDVVFSDLERRGHQAQASGVAQ